MRRGDRRAVNQVILLESGEGGRAVIRGSMDDDMRTAVLQRVVTDWSLPWPVPAGHPEVLDNLTIEQDDALSKAVEPHLDMIRGRNAPVKENENPTPVSES